MLNYNDQNRYILCLLYYLYNIILYNLYYFAGSYRESLSFNILQFLVSSHTPTNNTSLATDLHSIIQNFTTLTRNQFYFFCSDSSEWGTSSFFLNKFIWICLWKCVTNLSWRRFHRCYNCRFHRNYSLGISIGASSRLWAGACTRFSRSFCTGFHTKLSFE